MTHLRKLMLEELERRNYSQNTVRTYLMTIEDFARYFHKPPDVLGPEHVREYQAYLFRERKLAANTVNQRVGALRFFFIKTLKKNWSVEETPYPKRVIRLPKILSGGSRAVDRLRNHSVLSHHSDDALRHRNAASRADTFEDRRHR